MKGWVRIAIHRTQRGAHHYYAISTADPDNGDEDIWSSDLEIKCFFENKSVADAFIPNHNWIGYTHPAVIDESDNITLCNDPNFNKTLFAELL